MVNRYTLGAFTEDHVTTCMMYIFYLNQSQEQYNHEWAWRKRQELHQDRWLPAEERRGAWRPDFED